jgi:Ca2+-binding EF-hand superfamily protein
MLRSLVALCLLLIGSVAVFAQAPAPRQLPPHMAFWLKSTPDGILRRYDKDGDGYLSREEAPPFLRPQFDKADQNKDGKLDRQEIAAVLRVLRQRFAAKLPAANSAEVEAIYQRLLKLDSDGDGKISRAEAKGPLAKQFEKLDTNKDGYLDKSELRRAAQLIVALRQKGGAGAIKGPTKADTLDFDALDRNADGRLTRDEVRGTPLEPLFDQIDTNHDGRIDPAEFKAYLKKRQTGK